ncbi:ribosome recycling factor [bacterium]|nr:MAG: ribosome recycling factor [bacterium]QQR61716.1 MAG: ribosome recycling factor [bacterium]QQR62716.1 MAG: ribosome recycling factor [bacterium]
MKEIILEENNIKSFQTPMEQEAVQAIKHFEKELTKVRTGRAHTSLVEDLLIHCYGGQSMPLKSLAAVAAPESRLITIQPWDTSVIGAIENAITNSELGLTPINDGALIRLQLPQMTTARRDELLKVLNKKLEECKVSIRNVRKDFNNLLKDAKQNKKISENFFNRLTDVLQTVTDKYCKLAEEHATKKEKDITTV